MDRIEPETFGLDRPFVDETRSGMRPFRVRRGLQLLARWFVFSSCLARGRKDLMGLGAGERLRRLTD
jgi:hypothetical protein